MLQLGGLGRNQAVNDQLPEIPLRPIIDNAIAAMQAELDDVRGTVDIGELPEKVRGVADQLEQLFASFIENAVKYRDPARPLEIEIASRPTPTGMGTEIWVRDNGIGFPPGKAKFILEPFNRLHLSSEIEGSGLGLSICTRIAELHGFDLRAKGTPGVGARFVITFKND